MEQQVTDSSWALPSAVLSAHTAQALGAACTKAPKWPVSASITNAVILNIYI